MIVGDDIALKYLAGFLCSKVTAYLLDIINPTISIQVKDIATLPVISEQQDKVVSITKECISAEKDDWDAFETSWDFKKHPLV